MVFSDWTFSKTGAMASGGLDAAVKYSGNSSYKAYMFYQEIAYLTHNSFLNNKAEIICYCRKQKHMYQIPIAKIGHSAYSDVQVSPENENTWQKVKASFWYDIGTNTKWARGERWNGTAWETVQEINCGAGSPSNGSIRLIGQETGNGSGYVWFDEVEVYS